MSFKETEIGSIPEDWEFDKIGSSLYIKGRIGWKGLKKSEYVTDSEYRIINGSNIKNNKIDWESCGYISEKRYVESPEIMLRKNDIVMTKDGTIGKLSIVRDLTQKSTVASGLFVIRVEDNSIDVEYLYSYFTSHFFKGLIKSRTEGSVIPHLYQRDLVELKIPLPQLDEQKAIAKILSALDEKIEINNRINETLETIAQSIFHHWFVDFEFPNENGKPYKSSGGEMVESELGLIPVGWEVKSFGEIIKIKSGKRPNVRSAEQTEECAIPLAGASCVMGFTSESNYSEQILVIGRVGTHGVVQRFYGPVWASDNTLVIKTEFFYYVYQRLCGIDYSALNRGSTQPLITQRDIKGLKFITPSIDILSRYEEEVVKYFEAINNLKKENECLLSLRDTLLPKLMSGEIRVPISEDKNAV